MRFHALLFALIPITLGFPSWDVTPRGLDDSALHVGTDALTAMAPGRGYERTKALVLAGSPGTGGQAFIMDHPQPPQFFIKAGQLYEMYNETSILYGNIYNTTDSSFAPLPFKLTFGPTKMGVQDGHWAWKGTQLFYHHGNSNNFGLFFSCSEPSGTRGVYLDLKVRRTPNECDMTTLHSLGKARYA